MGWREPSAAAKVPAPQGEPGRNIGITKSSHHINHIILTTVDLREICQLGEGAGIAEGNVADAMVGESREAPDDCGLLPTTMATSGDEHASILSVQLSTLPQAASGIPEGLQIRERYQPRLYRETSKIYAYPPLSWYTTVASGDTDEEAIELSEIVGSEDGVAWPRGCMHLGQDFLRESLGDPAD